MGPSLSNIFRLGVKELHSVRRDAVMMGLIVYTFSFAVYVPSRHAQTELRDGSVAIVDADRSQLSARIGDALMAPYMQPAVAIDSRQADAVLDAGKFTFVIEIPPKFQADAAAGRRPTAQVIIDATAITQAAQGAAYIRSVIEGEAQSVVGRDAAQAAEPITVISRARFNPNLQTQWFMGVMQFINVITILSIVLTGAALMRERERGTVEHLLVLPVTPFEIMAAKVWANALMVTLAATLSLKLVIQGVLDIPIAGSITLFLLGMIIYLYSGTSLGIFLATLARSMPQFGLLAFPVFMVMILLSGGLTP
ncbi:MAG TPA: ABC transporter permease, partial [Roseiflexaceae bacterium]|nr:ABC transporter permease [Roseiflexaceae bacterium]